MSSDESETRKRILAAAWRLMEEHPERSVRMRDIAEATGVSRQALYLHFASRADLLVATTRYGDEIRGLEARLFQWRTTESGEALLAGLIDLWGHYIPEIYGIARALFLARQTDEAAAIAWDERMGALRSCCTYALSALHRQGKLAPSWTLETAIDLLWTLLSIQNWELLTHECKHSTDQYVSWLQTLTHNTFVQQ